MEVIVDRCAALDVHLMSVMGCVRTPGQGRHRRSEVREYATFTKNLGELRERLSQEGVTQIAMEATGVYWRSVYYALAELQGVELLVVNARHVKNVPGRKTDAKDAEWLCQLLESGVLKGASSRPRPWPSCGN